MREKTLTWKIKALAAKITYRIFLKYGKIDYLSKKDVEFGTSLVNTFG
jgi:hypothetical protein